MTTLSKARVRPIREIPYMGVIQVVHEASKLWFYNGNPDWCNLGQGQPEIGEMEGAPPRLSALQFTQQDCGYGPVAGIDELRELVAEEYNRRFRQGKRSRYTKENVAIAAGGRLMLSRLLATLASVRVGHVIPDYTAYEEMLAYHSHRFTPVPVETAAANGFQIKPSDLDEVIDAERLDAFLLSNPRNPTGTLVAGESLKAYVETARRTGCWLLLDEFYSHFVFEDDGSASSGAVSAASFVEDVDQDPVVLVDGLTKNHRYPGWRIGWVVGPREVVDAVARAASAIDGGPPTVMQRLAVQALQPERSDRETTAMRRGFALKRKEMLEALTGMGIEIPFAGNGTFYLWGKVDRLPASMNTADKFFRAALRAKVMTVPGQCFDVNPGKSRSEEFIDDTWMRFSFGPQIANMRLGLERMRKMIAAAT